MEGHLLGDHVHMCLSIPLKYNVAITDSVLLDTSKNTAQNEIIIAGLSIRLEDLYKREFNLDWGFSN